MLISWSGEKLFVIGVTVSGIRDFLFEIEIAVSGFNVFSNGTKRAVSVLGRLTVVCEIGRNKLWKFWRESEKLWFELSLSKYKFDDSDVADV